VPAPITWIDPAGGSWHDPANWDLGREPADGDTVLIPSLPGNPTIEYSTGIVILGGLVASEAVSLTGGSLRVNGTVSGSGPFSFSAGTHFATSVAGGPVALAGGALVASNVLGGPYTLSGGTLVGATVAAGTLVNVSGGTLDGVTLDGDVVVWHLGLNLTFILSVANGLTLNGTLTLGPTDSNSTAQLRFVGGDQTLGGSGTVRMLGAGTYMSPTGTDTLTVGPNVTISGHGAIGSLPFEPGPPTNGLVLRGTVLADVPGRSIGISAADWSNEGVLRAVNGAGLSLRGGAWSSTTAVEVGPGGTASLEGTVANAGKTLALTGGGTFTSVANVTGGVLNVAPGTTLEQVGGTLDGVTIEGELGVGTAVAGSTNIVSVRNGLTLNGTLSLGMTESNSFKALYFEGGDQTLGGSGTVRMLGQGNYVSPTGTDTLTVGPNVTISGRGSVGAVAFQGGPPTNGLVLRGTVLADVPGRTVSVYAASISNEGVLRAVNGSNIGMSGALATPGALTGEYFVGGDSSIRLPSNVPVTNFGTVTLAAPGARLEQSSAANALAALVRNASSGTLLLRDGTTLTVPSLINEGRIVVDATNTLAVTGGFTQGATGTLVVEIGGPPASNLFGRLAVGGVAGLDGALEAPFVNGFVAAPGQAFRVISHGSRSGTFSNFLGSQLAVRYEADGVFLDVSIPPRVQSVVVNDGSAQRSMVTSLAVTFDTVVTLPANPADAFLLERTGGAAVGLQAAVSVLGGRTVVLLTFTGGGIVGGSLADGNYRLTVLADQVTDAQGNRLDGNGDGNGGDNRVDAFFRLFGDTDGDRDVDNLDFLRFRGTFGLSAGQAGFLWYLDFNNDGRVNAADLVEFNRRRGTVLPP
jgi:hypothetical protein